MNNLRENFSEKTKTKLSESGTTAMLRFAWLKSAGQTLDPSAVTANNRVYPMPVVNAALADFKKRIEAGAAFGSAGHVKDGFEVPDVSHKIEDVGMDPDGTCWAEAKILGDTPKGKTLLAILRNGGKIGASLRGAGQTKSEKGHDVIQPGFKINGIDFTLNPASEVANNISKESFFESASVLDPEQKDIAEIRYERAVREAGYNGTLAEYEKEFSKMLTERVVEEKKVAPKLSQEDIIETRYRQACRAGFMGTKREYRQFLFPETIPAPGIAAVKAAPKELDEKEAADESQADIDALLQDYVSKANDPDAPEIKAAIQGRLDDMFEGAWVLVDHSDKLAVITWVEDLDKPKEEREYFVQPYHLTSLPQKVALHGEQTKVDVTLQLKESKWKVTTEHPTEKAKVLHVNAKSARHAAGKAKDQLKEFPGHSIASIEYEGGDDASDQDQRSGS